MTQRGLFSGILDQYDFDWSWKIQLLEVDTVPVSTLLRAKADRAALRQVVTEHLRAQRKKHEAYSNRHFVYFVARRPRVKFSAVRPARLRADHVEFRLSVGKDWFSRSMRAAIPWRAVDGVLHAPIAVQVRGDYVTFHFNGGSTATWTLFDYLGTADLDLGLSAVVEYVGMTAKPEDRPTNLEHRGLLETVHDTDPEREEVFIMFNTFHVLASTSHSYLSVVASNSLTDQLRIREESEYVEKLFIDYFEPAQQRCSLSVERACLRRLEEVLRSRRVRTVELTYEVEATSDLYRTGSARVPASRAHAIRRSLADQV